MKNYMVSFRNGPTIMVRATCREGAKIAARAQTKRPFSDIKSVKQMARYF